MVAGSDVVYIHVASWPACFISHSCNENYRSQLFEYKSRTGSTCNWLQPVATDHATVCNQLHTVAVAVARFCRILRTGLGPVVPKKGKKTGPD